MRSQHPAEAPNSEPAFGPATPLLATSFLLAGLGTVLLGPLLPALLREWSLSDARGGLLLLAKFAGAFVGGVSVPNRLRLGNLAGHLLTAAGFASFSAAHGLGAALPALFVSGIGLGGIIASSNVLAGRRWPAHTGSALSLINLLFSLGAVSTGLLVAAFLPHFGWRRPTLALAVLFAIIGTAGFVLRRIEPQVVVPAAPTEARAHVQDRRVVRFALLIFLYGGLETCLTAWLTTFSLRFGGGALLGGQSGFVVLWAALTAGRGLASLIMRHWSESSVLRRSLAVCLLLIVLLATAQTAGVFSTACILLGLALAPVFPSTFALLLHGRPTPRTAGAVLAVSGLGAALFPWLMGLVSTSSGSLRVAMIVPALLIPVMLGLTGWSGISGVETFATSSKGEVL